MKRIKAFFKRPKVILTLVIITKLILYPFTIIAVIIASPYLAYALIAFKPLENEMSENETVRK